MGYELFLVLGMVFIAYAIDDDWLGGKLLNVKEYFGRVLGNDWQTTIFSCVDGTIILCLMLSYKDKFLELLFWTGFGDSLFLDRYLDSYSEEDMPFLWLERLEDRE